MNARQQLKPKTIRLAILLALADGAITTIDDLQTKIDEPRGKVANAVYPAANEGLIKRLRDDVTSLPAYQITAKGREHLASFAGVKEEVAGIPRTAEDFRAVEPVDEAARQHHEAVALDVLETAMPGFTAEVVAQKDAEIHGMMERLDHIALMLRNSSAYALAFEGPIEMLLANILHKAARQQSPVGYVVKRPGKPLARFTKAESAQASAMVTARAGKRAQVFGLVLIGAAVPGAEWVEA